MGRGRWRTKLVLRRVLQRATHSCDADNSASGGETDFSTAATGLSEREISSSEDNTESESGDDAKESTVHRTSFLCMKDRR